MMVDNSTSNPNENTQEIDLLDLARKIWAKRKLVIKYAAIGAVVGLVIGFSIPNEFTSSVTMTPEGGKGTQGGSMAGLAAMAGINIGSTGVDGINQTLYPDVVKSMPFLIEMSQIAVTSKKGEKQTLYHYVDQELSSPWWSYVLSAPMRMVGGIVSIFSSEEKSDKDSSLNPKNLTKKQEEVLTNLSNRITLSIDKKTNVISASSTMQDAGVAATVTDSMVNKLQEYIANYRTEKAKRDLEFTRQSYQDAREKYITTQRAYAAYMDATQNVARQSVRAEQDRLRNEQLLAYSVYSQLAQQLEMAKMKVQEETPCVTVINPAGMPNKKSNASKAMLLLVFAFLGGFGVIGVVVVKDLFLAPKDPVA